MQAASVDFTKLRCTVCNRNLSVPPIYLGVDPKHARQNSICGRCFVPLNQNFIRNTTFEVVAEHLQFPCSFSDKCGKKAGWKDTFHEDMCPFRPSKCPICPQTMPLNATIEHYRKNHNQKLYEGGSLVVSGSLKRFPYPHNCLLIVNDLVYLVTVSRGLTLNEPARSTEIIVSVKVLRCRPDISVKRLSITYTYKDQAVTYQNTSEANFNKKINNIHVRDSLGCDAESEIQMEIIVRYENMKEINAKNEIFKIFGLLNCPICMQMIADKVVTCRKGHSICLGCKPQVRRCPVCTCVLFHEKRNFPLEQIRKRLHELL